MRATGRRRAFSRGKRNHVVIIVLSLAAALFVTLLVCSPTLRAKLLSPFTASAMDNPAKTTEGTAVTRAAVSLHSGAGTSDPVTCTLQKGTTVQLLTKPAGDWVKVSAGSGKTGWCSKNDLNIGGAAVSSSVSPTASSQSKPVETAAAGSTAIATDGVHIRSGGGTSYPVVGSLVKGATVQLLSDYSPSVEWVRVSTDAGLTGWCAKEYLNVADTADAMLKNSSSGVSPATAAAQVSLAQAKSPLSVSVSIAAQRVTVYDSESRIVKQFICSTGEKGSDTPTGTFRVAERGKSFYSDRVGEGGYFWTQFKGDYLFHSVPFDKNYQLEPTEAAKLGKPASHGCVRLAINDAKWIYDNIPRGTRVTVR